MPAKRAASPADGLALVHTDAPAVALECVALAAKHGTVRLGERGEATPALDLERSSFDAWPPTRVYLVRARPASRLAARFRYLSGTF